MDGIWKGVLLTEVSDLGEPRVLDAVMEDMEAMLV